MVCGDFEVNLIFCTVVHSFEHKFDDLSEVSFFDCHSKTSRKVQAMTQLRSITCICCK
jgi:hypothetical protein